MPTSRTRPPSTPRRCASARPATSRVAWRPTARTRRWTASRPSSTRWSRAGDDHRRGQALRRGGRGGRRGAPDEFRQRPRHERARRRLGPGHLRRRLRPEGAPLEAVAAEIDEVVDVLVDYADDHDDVDFEEPLTQFNEIVQQVHEVASTSQKTLAESELVAGAAEEQAAELNEVSGRAQELTRNARALGDVPRYVRGRRGNRGSPRRGRATDERRLARAGALTLPRPGNVLRRSLQIWKSIYGQM